MTLPTDATARKNIPVYSGFVKYFPRGMCAVARLSKIGNDQHNPGQPLHWAKEKSTDELDAFMRHMVDDALGVLIDSDDVLHATKMAWRAMANLERILEAQEKAAAAPAVVATKPYVDKYDIEKDPSPALPGQVIMVDSVNDLPKNWNPPTAKMKRFVEGGNKGEYIGLSNPEPASGEKT